MQTSRNFGLPLAHDWHRLPGMMMAISAEARLLALNDALAACTGWQSDAASANGEGGAWLEQLAPASRSALMAALEPACAPTLPAAPRFRVELQFQRDGGAAGWIECQGCWNAEHQVCLCVLHDLCASKLGEQALRAQTTQLRLLADNVPALIAYYEREEFRCTFANRHYAQALGWTTASILGRTAAEVVGERGWQQIRPYIEAVVQTRRQVSYERELRDATGQKQWLEVDVLPNLGDGGELYGAFVRVTDITKHRLVERALRESEQRLASFMDASLEGILFHRDGVVLDVNGPICDLTGYTRDEMIGRRALEFVAPDHVARAQQVLVSGTETRYESVALGKDGRRVPVEVITRSIRRNGEPLRLVIVRDIRERLAAQSRIHHLAHHDALTGLPNRAAFVQQLEQLTGSHRADDAQSALLFIDLDHFKRVNDSLGHLVGDLLLQTVTARITDCLRTDDCVARFGGDEFMVLLTGVTDRAVVEQVAGKLLAAIEAPLDVGGRPISVSPSIGVALFPEHGRTPAELIQHADAAMYQAKARGRATIRFFDPDLASAAYDALVIEGQLSQALATGAFELHYQPQLRARDGRLVGRGGAHPLAPPRARPAAARRLHPGGRAAPADAADRPLGAARGAARRARLACRRAGAAGVRQPVEHAIPAARLCRRARATARARAGQRRLARARTDRAHADGRPGRSEGGARAHPRAGHPHLDRRLRHRLLLARALERAADRQGQDRPLLRARPARQP